MLLAIDVGNTNLTCGIFDGETPISTFRMTTKQPRTSDEFGICFCLMVENRGVKKEQITDVIIASVVPDVMHSLTNAMRKYFGCMPLIVGSGIRTGLRISMPNPKEMGADRVVDAVAAYELYGGPVLVVDFGTATTYDLVTASGELIAGVTAPGIRISANALWNEAAKLPEIEIARTQTILAKDTIASMQAGLFYGTIGQTEYIVKKMIDEALEKNLLGESKREDVKVVATGGLGTLIADYVDFPLKYDPMLTLSGLYRVFRKNSSCER